MSLLVPLRLSNRILPRSSCFYCALLSVMICAQLSSVRARHLRFADAFAPRVLFPAFVLEHFRLPPFPRHIRVHLRPTRLIGGLIHFPAKLPTRILPSFPLGLAELFVLASFFPLCVFFIPHPDLIWFVILCICPCLHAFFLTSSLSPFPTCLSMSPDLNKNFHHVLGLVVSVCRCCFPESLASPFFFFFFEAFDSSSPLDNHFSLGITFPPPFVHYFRAFPHFPSFAGLFFFLLSPTSPRCSEVSQILGFPLL